MESLWIRADWICNLDGGVIQAVFLILQVLGSIYIDNFCFLFTHLLEQETHVWKFGNYM